MLFSRRTSGIAFCLISLLATQPALAAGDAALSTGQAEYAALEKKAGAESQAVASLKKKLLKTTSSLRATEENLAVTEQRLQNLRQQKAEYIRQLYHDQKALGGLVAAAERYRRTSTPHILMQSSPIDAARAATVMRSVIPALDAQSNAIKERLNHIAQIEENIDQQLQAKSDEYKKITQKEVALAALLKDRRHIYKRTENERKAQEKKLRKLAQESKNLAELVQKIKPKPLLKPHLKTAAATAIPGASIMPVVGKITTGFGKTDEIGAKSDGISFSARAGASVVTPLAGTVKFAGPFQKYKQILIIEHKGGYHSLIAGLGRIDTVVGATLIAGEPIGIVDSTGTNTHRVYYELRHNGAPINPKRLLVAQSKQDKS